MMFMEVEKKQFEIQQLKENLVSCTFHTKNRFLPETYEVLVKSGHKFYELIKTIEFDKTPNWWTLSVLANICKDYNGVYLT